nr:PREDICTED: hexosaminidase 1 isoform X1 [Tribolium castaneum]|eukprot:XP_015837050.1 PREDICTED: hexosaminidase 1 isoform X1 [Tribolium castaneum]
MKVSQSTVMKHSLATYLLFLALLKNISALNGAWRWECKSNYCQKAPITPDTEATGLSLPACRLFCSEAAALWPKPTGEVHVGTTLVKVNINSINTGGLTFETAAHKIMAGATKRFRNQIEALVPRKLRLADGGKTLEINYKLIDPDLKELNLDTKESYALTVAETADGRLNATIIADNVFGGRHGLETLNQLIIYDDLRDQLLMPNDVSITDEPAYQYRGIALDTSRNFVTVDVIKRTLDGMAASKLNSFHWHITDSHSFPFTAESLPDLTKYGAYSPKKVYAPEEVAEIVEYGLERGVRVIPEFDAPAHVGEGWQNTDFVVCFNAKPWSNYCVEPPCGQLDPTKEKLYDAIEALYGDMLKQFKPPLFHMGGDEVHLGCWNSTPSIVQWMQDQKGWGRSEGDFIKLWDMFQNESLTRLYKKAGKEIPVILWTSTLTQKEYLENLPSDKYIIQIWTTGSDPQVRNLLDNGYRVILSNYDALYFDCGFAGWVTDGNNWCSPYIGWQKVYENKPAKIAGDKKGQVLGAEAALWTEQADSASVDTRLWPRAAALGEVLWSEPTNTWREAEQRILVQRERLISLGINSDALEPEWCWQNEENCPIGEDANDEDDPNSGNASENSITILLLVVTVIYLSINNNN